MSAMAIARHSRRAACLVLLCVLITLIYWPGLGGGYVFDDYPNIVDNTALHLTWNASIEQWISAALSSPSAELKRPLAMISFAANFALTGADPYWMKATNLFIHLLNTCLVFALVRTVLQLPQYGAPTKVAPATAWLSLWIAAAWGLQPINVTPVLLVVQRMESLCHLFVFAGLWIYAAARLRTVRTDRGWLQAASGIALGTGLGLLSKESAALLPLYALTLEFCVLGFATQRGTFDRRLMGTYAIMLCVPIVIGLAWLLPAVSRPEAFAHRDFTLIERLLTEARVIVDYLQWTLLPRLGELGLYHDDYIVSHGWLSPPSTLLAAVLLVAIAGSALALRKRRPIMTLGFAWFACAHLLTATIIPLELVFEHRNYFASLGLMLVVADLLALCFHLRGHRPWLPATVALLLLAFYSTTTTLRVAEWSEPVRFSLSEAARHPASPRASYDVARNVIIASNFDPASGLVDEAFARITDAMRMPGASTLTDSAGIMLAARTQRPIPKQWWQRMQSKLSARAPSPQDVSALEALVRCQVKTLCDLPRQEMIDSLLSAMAQGPTPQILHVYGDYAINVLHDPELALALWDGAVELAPRQTQYRVSLINLLVATGDYEGARRQIEVLRSSSQFGRNDALVRTLLDAVNNEQTGKRGPLR